MKTMPEAEEDIEKLLLLLQKKVSLSFAGDTLFIIELIIKKIEAEGTLKVKVKLN